VDDDAGRLRLRIFAFVALILFGALFTRLWYLQGIEYEVLSEEAETNVLRQVFEEAPRGRILDRNGRVLVDNKVVDVVTIDKAVLEDLDEDEQREMFHRLATAISRSGRLTKLASIEREVDSGQYGPFDVVPVAVDVDPNLLVYLGERPDDFPGVDVVSRTVRSYPFGRLAAHLLGYVGPVTLDELQTANARIDQEAEQAKTYQLSDEIGKTGVERVFEDVLRGVPGVRYLEVDNRGEVIGERTEFRRPPLPGADLFLTIDVDLQSLVEQELSDGLAARRLRGADPGDPPIVAAAGAAVAVDPRDGGLLAMASYPTYDPSEFVNGISFAQFELLTSPDNFQPILNRAIQGTYAPGSTFKAVTAVAALERGYLGPSSRIDQATDGTIRDTGTYTYSGCRDDLEAADTCEFESPFEGDETFPLPLALSVSSDVFFYTLGGEGFWREPIQGPEGDEGIQAKAREFGLGASTGIQLPYERSGVVPDRDYFDAQAAAGVFLRDGSQWFPGDTIQLAIGQGDLLVTPTQLANLYATVGNGGTLHQINVALRVEHSDTVDGAGTVTPGEVFEFGPRVLRDLEIPADDLAQVQEGLEGVPRGRGTASRAFAGFPFELWDVAGKTGTAEVRGRADTSLFVAYGPTNSDDPEIAIAVVLEESGFGSSAAAPIVRGILEPVARDELPRARTFDEIESAQATRLAALSEAEAESESEEAAG
jgi:penicillin-binding protein 2